MSISGINQQTYRPPVSAGENADLKAERKQILRDSMKESNEAFKISEQKKNNDQLR
ncbi:type III secretion effector protein [Pseudomonas fluorescens]|uniref:type III secretion effector protein n=1 Tax=Pseudomonas fluorescens TaxID=294 RepID=UPI000935CF1D|nr:type III secretion effector protein [Pseudomonas fluorescens]